MLGEGDAVMEIGDHESHRVQRTERAEKKKAKRGLLQCAGCMLIVGRAVDVDVVVVSRGQSVP